MIFGIPKWAQSHSFPPRKKNQRFLWIQPQVEDCSGFCDVSRRVFEEAGDHGDIPWLYICESGLEGLGFHKS